MSAFHILFDSLPSQGTAGEVLTCEGTSAIAQWSNVASLLPPYLQAYVPPTKFSPVLQFGGANVGITYLNQSGIYTQMANVIEFTVFITLTSKGTSTGVATVTGLPVTSGGNVGWSFPMMNTTNVTPGANCSLLFSTLPTASNTFGLFQANQVAGSPSAIAGLADTNFSNTSSIVFQGTYNN